MSNVVRPPFVFCVPMPEGERFALIQETAIPRLFLPAKPGEEVLEAVRRHFVNSRLYTEEHLRVRLAEMGLDEAAASEQIRRARRIKDMNRHGSFSYDHITSIGFRNREGQQVIRKTTREGSAPAQRVFILHCTVCDHEYGAEGCDIYDRLCPKCQDGPPGLPA
jgi:hypothetical protein